MNAIATADLPLAVMMLPVAALIPGDDFRLDDNTDDLAELAASIAEHGVLQPLLVRQIKKQWEVVAGRRRLAAARQAGLDAVPCVVRALSKDQATDAAIAENIHRRNLSPIEEAMAFAHLRHHGASGPDIARRTGRSTAHVYNLLKLLEFPEDVRAEIHSGRLRYTNVLGNPGRFVAGLPAPGERQGGGDRGRNVARSADEIALVSYWRRRHDRVVGGLYAIQNARPVDGDECLRMIDKLIKLDAQPFPETAP